MAEAFQESLMVPPIDLAQLPLATMIEATESEP
jgi:hypothetical protein